MKVAEWMTEHLHTVSSSASVASVADRMNQLKIGSLLVKEEGEIVGIITSRDVRSSHPNRIAADAMSSDLVSVPPDCFIWDALQIMEEKELERLVVKEKDQVRGMITREAANVCMSRMIDPLTGLYRADYVRVMTEYFLEVEQPFLFLFIDLDDFGKINKRYGHQAGDDLLKQFAKRLLDMKKEPYDHICRYAGDEFIFLTTRSNLERSELIEAITRPIVIEDAELHASIGVFQASDPSTFAKLTFREILRQSSLMCSNTKKQIS